MAADKGTERQSLEIAYRSLIQPRNKVYNRRNKSYFFFFFILVFSSLHLLTFYYILGTTLSVKIPIN
jgi:hypothetical protein